MLVKELNINTNIVYMNVIDGEETTTFMSTKDEVLEKYGDNEVIEYYPYEGEEPEVIEEEEIPEENPRRKKKKEERDTRQSDLIIRA